MKVGYGRVSTEDQNEDLQVKALRDAGCTDIFVDKGISGAVAPLERVGFCEALAALPEGGTLMVWRLDRLGRSLSSIITTIDSLPARDIQFVSLSEHIDTNSIHGRALWQIIGVFAELERLVNSERTRAGLQAAKARGIRIGRPPALDASDLVRAQRLIGNGFSVKETAARIGVGTSTLYKHLSAASA